MKIVIRVDASIEIGIGHIMRCLTLADALLKQAAEVSFICRVHEGNLIQYIKNKGYVVYSLALSLSEENLLPYNDGNPLAHQHWLGTTQYNDAKVCEPILEELCPDWLLVDHYALDYHWQNQLKDKYKKLMVIDDLADRKHECDLLLDQTFGRKKYSYKELVPHSCELLLGSQYALLRPEFSQWREYSLQRRIAPELKNILVSMGGVDQNNVTSQILQILKTCDLPEELTITIVLGISSPNIEIVKQIAVTMPNTTEVKVDVDNMAELMANADVSIGAAGATTWERCCLGVPSILIVLADNQKIIAQHIAENNIGVVLKVNQLNTLCDSLVYVKNHLKNFSLNSAEVINGKGTSHTIGSII